MAQLYGRKWRVVAGAGGRQVEVTALRVAFKVEASHKPEPNGATIEIYNLSKDSRSRLSQDFERDLGAEFVEPVSATLEAGYDGAFPLIFQGKIARVWHRRDGPDWTTTLEADDGAHQLAAQRVQQAFGQGAQVEQVFRAVANKLGVGVGNALEQFKTGNFGRGISQFSEGIVVNGTGRDVLDQMMATAGLEYSVQNEALVVTRAGEPLPGQAVELAPETGLIGAPEPGEKGLLRCKALIRPGLGPARPVELRTDAVSGSYRVQRVVYSGDSHGNDWYADLDLQRA